MMRWLIAIIAASSLFACQKSAVDPAESVVGAKELPPIEVLNRETLELNRFRGTQTEPEMLVVELRPDNVLEFTLSRRDLRRGDTVLGKESFKLQREKADRIRRLLWRLRPAKLEGIQKQVLPTGCYWMFDEPPEFTAAFMDPNGESIGATDVQQSCKSPAATTARQIATRVLSDLPKTKLADAFWTEHEPLR